MASASVDYAFFESHGSRLLGVFYRAAGETPRPTALFLHGLPGLEQNRDLAAALRDAGWNSLIFHYRGAWGSHGDFSLPGTFADVRAAADWLAANPYVDPDRLAVIGMSFGGYLTLTAGAADPRFQALISMCPPLAWAGTPLPASFFDDIARALHGVTGAELAAQRELLPPVSAYYPQLRGRPVLLVTGDQDELFPADYHAPLLAAVPTLVHERFPAGDHYFSACRRPLIETILTWLQAAVP